MKIVLESDLIHTSESDVPYLQMRFENCGSHSLLFYPGPHRKSNQLEQSDLKSIDVEFSLNFLRRILHQDLEILRDFGKNIDKNLPAVMGNRSFPITSAMKQILVQIIECSFSGTLKRLFIEAKVIELLTLQITQINALPSGKRVLKKLDMDKLNEVRAMLLDNIHNPYSIEELSKTAGINRTKLQEGFKELFGTTIFGFITDIRLEEARQRIQDQSHAASIAEIAALAGYKNPQHFTAAFKRKYGFLPKELRG
ncbi:helix-turn-helix transcriptional regulator [Dyadobacter sp. CY347]|uniref:helix-turn-helix transcriptional regulator n=1 Tax=Dyadobacter sp. CY347 TaxID=2909336 RepID=UPI001F47E25D|nr:AraC family transcriptional regulator [Dyadobacter sp. CY347]MCF2489348.1 AraC family transcriptional regulator [Dyadobacter sp. CY347]